MFAQDLFGTDPTQETCAKLHSACTASTRQHQPDHADQSAMFALKDLDR